MLETARGARWLLAREPLLQAAARARADGQSVLVSQTIRVPTVEPIDLFEQGGRPGLGQAGVLADERFYWERPGDGIALVGVGASAVVSVDGTDRFAQVGARWRALLRRAIVVDDASDETSRGQVENPGQVSAGPVLLGGFAFEPGGPRSRLWGAFPAGRLVLPRLLMSRVGDVCRVTASMVVEPSSDPEAEQAHLEAEIRALLTGSCDTAVARAGRQAATGERLRLSATGGATATVTWETATAAHAPRLRDGAERGRTWQRLVADGLERIADGAFEKVVLARAVDLETDGPIEPEPVLRRLRAQDPSCIVFAIVQPGGCFVGATPEQLVRLSDGRFRVDCLAGTVGRGATPEEDRRTGQWLLANTKERSEHAVVVRMIRGALADVCRELTAPADPGLRLTRRLQHLHTPLAGRVMPGIGILALVERLHPTPAVGGWPSQAALAFIREREGFDRGWYAGPIGWIDQRGDGDFVVGIRSALLHGTSGPGPLDRLSGQQRAYASATLFAGCGIVAGSDPEREYAEAGMKLQPMLAALGQIDAA